MKNSHLTIVIVMFIMTIIAGSGCSSKPEVGSIASSSSVFSTDYDWVEYQITGDILLGENNATLKIEKSGEDYQGSPAIHVKSTLQLNSGAIVSDVYFDELMKNALGGTRTTTTPYGQTTTETLSAYELSDTTALNLVGEEKLLTFEGTESVTVPAGTYSDAYLYTNSTNGYTTSYWAESDIPVPVKVQDTSGYMSLVSWG